MIPNRMKRVSSLLIQEISEVIRREMKDPRVGFVTITDIEVTPDLSTARVYISVIGEEAKKKETVKSLNHASGFIRKCVQERIIIKRVPSFQFFLDDSIERGVHICALLDEIKKAEGGE
ncbi:MAG: 30S ribosome-binding factor RbfA [bacterium]